MFARGLLTAILPTLPSWRGSDGVSLGQLRPQGIAMATSACSPLPVRSSVPGSPAANDNKWVTYLLVSPTRSSIVGVAQRSDVEELIRWHNGESQELQAPSETTAQRPWRAAEIIHLPSFMHARRAARVVSSASGFRARITAIRDYTPKETTDGGDVDKDLSLLESLDGLTYVTVQVSNPMVPDTGQNVRALVDTGSSASDLQGRFIKQLQLPIAGGGPVLFETAAGMSLQSDMYNCRLSILGKELVATISPSEEDSHGEISEEDDEDYEENLVEGSSVGSSAEHNTAKQVTAQNDEIDREFGFNMNTDEAMLGFETLAALDLVVDCRKRRILVGPARGTHKAKFIGELPKVVIEFQNPFDSKKTLSVTALVDSGSTDCELQPRFISALKLPVDKSAGKAHFETAAGTIEAPIHYAKVKLLGQERLVRVSPSAESDGDDQALLGHDALAALGVLVDSRNRCLVLRQDDSEPIMNLDEHLR